MQPREQTPAVSGPDRPLALGHLEPEGEGNRARFSGASGYQLEARGVLVRMNECPRSVWHQAEGRHALESNLLLAVGRSQVGARAHFAHFVEEEPLSIG